MKNKTLASIRSSRSGKEKLILIQSPKGMRDILPQEYLYWNYTLATAEKLCRTFGYEPISTPILEETSLFVRSIGPDTDIVTKEMFSLVTRGGDRLTLRPEGTAPIARAYIEHGMANWTSPVKLFYTGPMFRHESPQYGRWREFHQIGWEIFGDAKEVSDAQVIILAIKILEKLGFKNFNLQINSIGCPLCRPTYRRSLISYFRPRSNKLCPNCKLRLSRNPLRILDCKEEKCSQIVQESPQSVDYLCSSCHEHFKGVLEYLDELDLIYNLNPRLVRGLDYYNRTVFEIWPEGIGDKQSALVGGGRYDGLIEILGGFPTPAVGASLGLDRVIEQLKIANISPGELAKPQVFLVQLGQLARKKSFKLFNQLINEGILAAESFGRNSIKSQLRLADKLGAKLALIIGQKEAIDNTIIIRDMTSGMQEIIDMAKIIREVKRRI